MGKAAKVREMIEAIAEDAWGFVPTLQEQAEELWRCIWSETSMGDLGGTWVLPLTRQGLREAAERAGCWWTWTASGEQRWMELAEAKAKFGRKREPMGEQEAMARLRTMLAASSGDDRRALEWAITTLADHVD